MNKAYEKGFMDKITEHGMTKKAKNLTRLLARVGSDLAGATERDLKFLARRGFKGFTPKQVQALRAKGLLPSIEQELSGFNKGTENMLKWTPKPKTPRPVDLPRPSDNLPYEEWSAAHDAYWNNYKAQQAWDRDIKNIVTTPAKEITRSNAPGTRYHANISKREIAIPDTTAPGTLAERESRAATARHEAREWVRGNAQLSKGRDTRLPGSPGFFGMFARPEVGSSHVPGVIHDERVFRSQLLNRLGSDLKWNKAPLGGLNPEGYYVRGARDSFVGNQPLPYEFDRIAEWRAISQRQAQEMRHLRNSVYRRGTRGPVSPELETSINELLSNPELQAAGLTPQQARRLIMANTVGFDPNNSTKRIAGSWFASGNTEEKSKALRKLQDMMYDFRYKPPELVSRTPAYRELDGILQGRGLDMRKYKDILAGETINIPDDSVLGKIRNMSIYTDTEPAKKLPELISERSSAAKNPSLIRRLLSMFGYNR